MSTLLLFFLTLSQAITAAATWSKSATVPFHQNPVQQLPLHAAHSNEQSLILTPSSSSKSTAVPGASGKNNGEIPGGSPLRFCDESRDTDLYSVDYIELHPFPLYIDDVFEVHLYGTFLQPITPNATWTFLAKYDPSSSNPDHESGSVDFCTSMDSIEQLPPLYSHFPDSHPRTQSCPPEKGYALIMMSAWVMPMFIVPGNYYFKFDAVTKQNQRIYCFETEIYLDQR